MGDLKIRYRELSHPLDFREQYLTNSNQSFCGTGGGVCRQTHNFLEIAPLEQLKLLHKRPSFEHIRRNFYTMVLLTSGTSEESIGYNTYRFEGGVLYFIPENQLHSIHHWSDDIKGYHCIFDADYFLLCLKNQVRLNSSPLLQTGNDPFIRLSGTDLDAMQDLFKKLAAARCSRSTKNDDLLVRLYLNVLFIEAEKIYYAQENSQQAALSRKEQLLAGFKRLVSLHFMEYRQVSEYARMLHVNAHYLNDTIKELTGKPASRFIHDQLLNEAKACLVQTDHTVSQIAFRLNFSDQSYFCRFFKKHTGMTAFQFRAGHRHRA
jgi:AraC-like DNA-binding protein